MFETVARRLLAGDFLCPYASPELHAWLLDEAARAEIDAWLARIGLRLALTRQGTAFYAAHAGIGSEERREAAEAFREVQQQLRPMVNFLVLAMRATQDDSVLMPGSLLEAAALHAAIDASPTLRQELQALAGSLRGLSGAATQRALLDRLLKLFADQGYLVLANAQRELYRVSGKVEYLYEVVDFLIEHAAIRSDEDEAEADDGPAPGHTEPLL
ncbi:hypothetical protein [Plasticicumulans sp.]|uniref:hypothetical protein n=1 Tax=Plasticicumulans sp. TaxID=2307179 RepID=UPI003925A44F|nr:hypothetical protein [Pseudomonadota bacterium]